MTGSGGRVATGRSGKEDGWEWRSGGDVGGRGGGMEWEGQRVGEMGRA